MEHSPKFERVKNYYDSKLWNHAMVENAVGKWITQEEADEILSSAESGYEESEDDES
jgi:hypothetical protein